MENSAGIVDYAGEIDLQFVCFVFLFSPLWL